MPGSSAGKRQATAGHLIAIGALLGGLGVLLLGLSNPVPEPRDHQCHLFGYAYGAGCAAAETLAILGQSLYDKTLPQAARETPSRDGWGFAYFLSPPHPGIERPQLIKSGAAACDDDARWQAAQEEIEAFGLPGKGTVIGHVRLSSYGPDNGALPNPHPFADSLQGRWWAFAHNGHMKPDTLMPWIPPAFLQGHPLDYEPVRVDSEVLFRYCLYEIERLGTVRDGLCYAFNRVKAYDDFLFNICLCDGDTLWAAHSHDSREFYVGAAADSSSWWVTTAPSATDTTRLADHHLYWFTASGMGVASYE